MKCRHCNSMEASYVCYPDGTNQPLCDNCNTKVKAEMSGLTVEEYKKKWRENREKR